MSIIILLCFTSLAASQYNFRVRERFFTTGVTNFAFKATASIIDIPGSVGAGFTVPLDLAGGSSSYSVRWAKRDAGTGLWTNSLILTDPILGPGASFASTGSNGWPSFFVANGTNNLFFVRSFDAFGNVWPNSSSVGTPNVVTDIPSLSVFPRTVFLRFNNITNRPGVFSENQFISPNTSSWTTTWSPSVVENSLSDSAALLDAVVTEDGLFAALFRTSNSSIFYSVRTSPGIWVATELYTSSDGAVARLVIARGKPLIVVSRSLCGLSGPELCSPRCTAGCSSAAPFVRSAFDASGLVWNITGGVAGGSLTLYESEFGLGAWSGTLLLGGSNGRGGGGTNVWTSSDSGATFSSVGSPQLNSFSTRSFDFFQGRNIAGFVQITAGFNVPFQYDFVPAAASQLVSATLLLLSIVVLLF